MTDDDRLRGYLKRAIADARDAKHRLREIQDRAHEPIAIVGIGCRFPGGVQTPEDLWRMVSTGGEGVSGFPTDRGWQLDGFFHPDPDHPGTSYVSEGAFLSGIGEFDPGFFGISPREAMATDPQQRLLLETSWECLERAGIRPDTLRGSDTGVFAGISALDYGIVLAKTESGRAGTLPMSTASSMVSGRISYTLGLEGPAITVDTACSSSLVSLHLAVRALRSNECSLALAGGVTVMSVPDPFVTFSRQRGLARDGRCKAFAAGADGFSLAEGVGVLAVQRLSDARREGRPVLGVISGTAVNQDGASSAFSAPNGPSQERVIRTALADAGLSTSDIDAVEAHGTGTSLGDPIEATALQAVYGKERLPGKPLWLGSVKSNIAHTQGAAGVAGVIKMVMAIHNGLLPKTLHVDEPSPHVDWDPDGVRLLTEAIDWPDTGRPRRAGVSSFGISGTNAHVILEQPAPPQESDGDTAATAVGVATETSEPAVLTAGSPASWPLSAATEPALREQARRLLSHLETDLDSSITDIGLSLATTRTAFEWRAALVGGDRAEFVRELAGLATDNPDVPVVRGRAAGRGRTVFVFPGQGSQWSGMALELLESSPVFARRFGECARALGAFVDWSPVEVLRGVGSAPSLDRVDVVQPVLFAVVVSLAELWRSVGVVPSAVVGHSQGEIAAACVAGVLSLEDAARVVALRSRLISEVLAGHGGMASVGLSDARVRELIGRWGGALSVAAVNGPGSTVVSGDADAVVELVTACEADGVQAKTIAVDYASHSAQVERIRAELVEVLDGIRPHAADVPLLSTVTGGWIDGARLDAEYWYRNLRGTVEFEGAIGTLAEQGYTTFIECSPHPVLTTSIEDTLTETNSDGLVTGTLRRDDGGPRRFLRSLGELDVHGVPVDRTRLFPGATRVELPTYAFQHQWYWPRPAPEDGDVHSAGLISAGHPLLAATVAMPASGGLALTGKLSVSTHPWLADHAVLDTVILPGTGFVELALRAGEEVGCARLEELTIAAPLVIPQDGGIDLHVAISPEDPQDTDRHAVTIHSRPAGSADAPWTTHAEGVLTQSEPEPSITLDQWPPADAAALDVAEIYGRLAAAGIDYGPTFHGLAAAWQCGDDVLAEIRLPDGAEPAADRFGIHPAVLDAALHPVGPVLGRAAKDEPDGGGDGARLPFSWRGVQLHAAGAAALRVRIAPAGPDELSVVVADESGKPVASVESLVLRPVAASQLGVDRDVVRDSLFTVEWPTLTEPGEPPAAHATTPAIQAFADRGGLTAALDSGAEIPGTVAVRVPDECAEPADDPLRVGLTGTLALLRRWLEEERLADTRLVVATRGAVAVHPGEDVAPAHAAVWGLVRSAQSEHPGRFVLLDLDDDESLDFALARADANEQLAIRDGTVHVPRLVRAALPDDDAPPLTFDPEGTVLITGGVGTLGGLVARHLATEHGVRHLMLASRRGGAAEGAVDLVNELCGLGTDVTLASCDVADRDAVAQLLQEIPDEHPLTAVVHTAGAIDDGVVGSLTDEQLDRVLRPKADGARNLHELTRGLDLSAFVVFSSAATTFGAAGQANYAAANAFLDALAQHRHALGLPAVSLAWGLWAERSGLTGDLSDSDLARMASGGVSAMPTADALALFDAGLTAGTPVLVPTPLDIRALRHRADSGTLPALLHALVPPRPRRVAGEASGNDVSGFLGRIAAMSDDDRSRALLDLVRSQAASVLGHDSVAEVEPERAFKELGFDSLTGVELRNRLAAVIGTRLPATLVFDHPTPLAIAGLLHDKLGGGQGSGIETVLAEIDSLDTRLADFEDGDRARITARLRALLAKTDVPGAAGETAQDLSSASDDEMFAFIDKQLGA